MGHTIPEKTKAASLGDWKGEQEGAAVDEFAFGADGAAVGEHDVLGDGQAEASATGLSGAGLVHAVKPFKQSRQVLGGNAGAEILNVEFDSELDAARRRPGPVQSAVIGTAVFHGVVNQVGKYLRDGLTVGEDGRQGLDRIVA